MNAVTKRFADTLRQGSQPQTVQLKSITWSGMGLSVDATPGDEKRRARTFHSCLIQGRNVLLPGTGQRRDAAAAPAEKPPENFRPVLVVSLKP